MSKTPDYIIAFAEAVYPECPELGLSMARSEEVILRDATKVILKLQSQLAASQERERILREGLAVYAQTGNWAHTEMNSPHRNLWMRWESGYDIAQATLKAAEEVK
jgi:hypothetical protein